ncbi:single-stranded DNA-binding protein [Scytonema millei]|uniref:Single-stranded DNA-binding protein n=1 Tax=Scytonema millei VB511283 TaxID=1245923 RepID=A0A9X5E950_9CYAN|nr:single-stranded DNA-binding protein [Scytonema millei]NHC36342.1 single-stranded DNA-binding protein [Scytonema millei VB511283]
MNSCILMAEIKEEPQLRHVNNDNLLAIAEMMVSIPGLRAEDPSATLRVVGWGKMADEIQQNYHKGDRVIIEGRLGMNTVERQEGFKEKRAELTAQRIHKLDGVNLTSSATEREETSSYTPPAPQPRAAAPVERQPAPVAVAAPQESPKPPVEVDEDDIPF